MRNIDCTSITGAQVHYEVSQCVGSGGFGSVYKVEDNGADGIAKVIKFADNLINECAMYEILADIIPMNIPKLFDRGKCFVDGVEYVYIIIEYIPYTLDNFASSFSHDSMITVAMNIYNELIDIFDKLHQHGFIHRDIKPSNILIKEVNGVYVPILIDFGLINDVIPIKGHEIYYAGTRCFSSIYQHIGLYCTPIDDFICLVYTWMQLFNRRFNETRSPWDCTFIAQERKKHEFYMIEKWKYLDKCDMNNFWDRVLHYLYNIPHFWTTQIDLRRLYYIDPLHRFSFEIHTISLPHQWKKMIKQESMTIDKRPHLSREMQNALQFNLVTDFISSRINSKNTMVNVSEYSLSFTYYMIRQYQTLVSYLWDNLREIVQEFIAENECYTSYMYKWLEHIQHALNVDNKQFDTIVSSLNTYCVADFCSFFNYSRCQTILMTAIRKLPNPRNNLSLGPSYLRFYERLNQLYARKI